MIKSELSRLGIYLWPMILLTVEVLVGFYVITKTFLLSRKEKENKSLKKAEIKYSKLVGNTLDQAHLLVVHDTRRVVFFTDRLSELVGTSKERIASNLKAVTDSFSKEERRQFWQSYNGWDREEPLCQEYEDTGSGSWMRVRVLVCPDDPTYDMFVFENIDERKLFEAQMEERLEQAEVNSQSKTTFLSRMSHEIRTPMNGIIGLMTLIRREPHNEMIEQYLDKAEETSDYLIRLINDILDISRIENGKLELEEKPFDLYDVANELKNMFGRTVEAKGLDFSVDTSELKHHHVLGDRLRLSQVLLNFLSNAAKFTERGEIRVTFKEMMVEQQNMSFMVCVHDTGKGMNPAFVKRIFRPFEQENSSINHKYGGTGLGMTITDNIIRAMGGKIVIDTMENRGSDFSIYLTLPLTEEVQAEVKPVRLESGPKPEYRLRGKHILMAEDNKLNAVIARELFEDMGVTLDLAENGKLALETFAEHPIGTYDFILMDIQMPEMDGRTATREIRKLPRPDAAQIPIFALSADAYVEDQRLSMESGMDGHFTKPIDFDVLETSIGKILSQKRSMNK